MKITRMDLDMTGSPAGLVTKILAAEPDLPTPTPIEELAHQLDVQEIAELETEGFEGGLLTTEERTSGIILVNKNSSPARRRFTISHELAHFLIPAHQPQLPGKFLCRHEDMKRWDIKDQDRYMRMEAEANLFAALILMPPPRLRAFMRTFKDPDITDILQISEHFQVSKEAAARSYAEYHDAPIAVVIIKDGKVLRAYKNREFPFITATFGKAVPIGSSYYDKNPSSQQMQECKPDVWFDNSKTTSYEQILRQTNGYATVLLWAEILDDECDEDEDRTSKERYSSRGY